MTLLAKVLGAAAVVAAPVWGFLKLWDRKADKRTVSDTLEKIDKELAIHRSHIAKLFDKLEEHARRDDDHHAIVLQLISSNQAELLRALGEKANRN